MSEPKLTTTLDEPLKQAREWRENGSPPEPFYAVGHLIDAMADRIEELEANLAKTAMRALERIEVSTDTREQGAKVWELFFSLWHLLGGV